MASSPTFCDRKKTPGNIPLTAVYVLWTKHGSAQMAVVQTQEHFWHREHLQTPCFQVSWGDTTKGCRPLGFRGFWCAHRCSQWDHTAIRAQLNHSMVFVRDRDRSQAANKVLFPLQPSLQALAGCWRVFAALHCWDGVWEWGIQGNAVLHQAPASHLPKRCWAPLGPLHGGSGKKGWAFLSLIS